MAANKPSRQQNIILEALRDMKWHCGREWLHEIKDDRARISNLNTFYMRDRGYEIKGEPCKGEICGRRDCPLYKRKAVKLGAAAPKPPSKEESIRISKAMVKLFDEGASTEQIFSIV